MASSRLIFLEDEILPSTSPYQETSFTAEPHVTTVGIVREESPVESSTKNIGRSEVDVEKGKEDYREKSLYFGQGTKRIDYVITYSSGDSSEFQKNIRKTYEKNLEKNGLQLEIEPKENSPNKETVFVKLHVPWDICLLYAERMRMKMPLKVEDEDMRSSLKTKKSILRRTICFSTADADEKFINESVHTAEFKRSKMEYFDMSDSKTFFNPTKRSRIAYRIMSESYYGDEKKDIGIEKLLRKGIYTAAFPLHDIGYKKDDLTPLDEENPRKTLYLTWARWRNWYKVQPLHSIRNYFGEKVGIYFAWLGFYTTTLVVPSAVGIVCLLYSLIAYGNHIPTKEICDPSYPTFAGNLTMCPLCDQDCTYWKLGTACRATIITRIFDNESTIFFVIFMLLWATMFLKCWKREQYRLSYEWNLVEYDEETALIRPEYEARVTREKLNPITHALEPYMSKLARFSRSSFSIVNVIFWILVVIAAVVSVTVFRLAMHAIFSRDAMTLTTLESLGNVISPSFLTTLTASMLSVLVILILSKIYEKVALWLTYVELPRTQLEFEDSFTLKIFWFQFVNYYSYLFYIAFFKNTLTSYPENYFYLFGRWRWEECDSGGCMYELTLQLFVIMFAKQMWNNIIELFVPWITSKYKHWRATKYDVSEADYTRWQRDNELHKFEQLDFFREYLELVIQYGFVTLFVVAFPLAPLLALLNNILEIRIDAHKLVCSFRRPLAQKTATIGAWFSLLDFLSTLAVVTNSITLAVTSSIIPQLVYFYSVSVEQFGIRTLEFVYGLLVSEILGHCFLATGALILFMDYSSARYLTLLLSYWSFNFRIYSLKSTSTLSLFLYLGFTENSLSVFDVSDFPPRSIPRESNPFPGGNVTECRYRDYRNPPSTSPRYHVTAQYWHIQAARVIFIVVIEHVVFFLKSVLDFAISDEPSKIKDLVKRDHYLVQNILLEAEKARFRRDVVTSIASRQRSYAPIKAKLSDPHHVAENPVT